MRDKKSLDTFAALTCVVWIPLWLIGVVLGWFSAAVYDGFRQGFHDFLSIFDS